MTGFLKQFLVIIVFLTGFTVRSAAAPTPALRTDYYERCFNNPGLPLEKRILFGDSLIGAKKETLPWNLYMRQDSLLCKAGRIPDALRTFEALLPRVPADSLRMHYAALWQVAKYNLMLRRYRPAVHAAYTIARSPKPDSLAHFNLYAYTLLVDFYNFAHDPSMAWKYQKEGLALLRKLKPSPQFSKEDSEKFTGLFHRLAAMMHLDAGDPDKAYRELGLARKSTASKAGETANNHLMAQIAALKGQDDVAETWYRDAIEGNSPGFNRPLALTKYMKFLLDRNRSKDAQALYNTHSGEFARLDGNLIEASHLENMARLRHIQRDFESESALLAHLVLLKDSLLNTSLAVTASIVDEGFESFPSEPDMRLREGLERKASLLTLIIVLLLVAGTGVCTFLIFRLRRTRERLRKNRQLLETADDRRRLEQQRNLAELETRSRELTAMTMHMARINETLDTVAGIAADKERNPAEALGNVSRALRQLDRQDNMWELFNTYFNGVHRDFFDRLALAAPKLTKAEVRMCAYMRMGLATKEISTLTNRSPRTVEAIKYNLRKKLGLTVPTEDFLKTL